MMKRILLVSCLLVSAVLLIAVAGEKAFFGEPEGLPSGVRALDVTAPNPEQAANDAPALDMAALEAELEIISEQIVAQKQAGLEPDPGLYERLVEIERQLYPRPEGDALDQGSETCDAATVIDNTEPVAFCDTGIMGATDDCTLLGGAAYSGYRDVSYTFTPMHTGLYVVSTGGSVGYMYLKIWHSTCCAGNTAGFDDDSCGGLDSRRRLTLTEGVQYWFEVGYYSSSQAADVYNFNLFGPLPVPPEVPANDVCLTATPIASLPATISGTTYGAADETQAPTCGGTTQSYGGLYYTVVGPEISSPRGRIITAPRLTRECACTRVLVPRWSASAAMTMRLPREARACPRLRGAPIRA